jgi:hypothetical protein
MNRLDPGLRRLIGWARMSEADGEAGEAPAGFAGRAVALWRAEGAGREALWWRQVQVVTVWASVMVVAGGAGVWMSQRSERVLGQEVFPVYQLAVRNLAP